MSRIPPLEGTANGWQWGQHRPTNLAPTMINGGHNQRRMTVTIICQCSVERYSTLGMDQTDYIRLHYLGGWTSFTFYFHVNFRQSYFQLLFFLPSRSMWILRIFLVWHFSVDFVWKFGIPFQPLVDHHEWPYIGRKFPILRYYSQSHLW